MKRFGSSSLNPISGPDPRTGQGAIGNRDVGCRPASKRLLAPVCLGLAFGALHGGPAGADIILEGDPTGTVSGAANVNNETFSSGYAYSSASGGSNGKSSRSTMPHGALPSVTGSLSSTARGSPLTSIDCAVGVGVGVGDGVTVGVGVFEGVKVGFGEGVGVDVLNSASATPPIGVKEGVAVTTVIFFDWQAGRRKRMMMRATMAVRFMTGSLARSTKFCRSKWSH